MQTPKGKLHGSASKYLVSARKKKKFKNLNVLRH